MTAEIACGQRTSADLIRGDRRRVAAAVPRSLEALFRMADEHIGKLPAAAGKRAQPGGPSEQGDLLDTQKAVQVDLAMGPPALPRLLARLAMGPEAYARAVRCRISRARAKGHGSA